MNENNRRTALLFCASDCSLGRCGQKNELVTLRYLEALIIGHKHCTSSSGEQVGNESPYSSSSELASVLYFRTLYCTNFANLIIAYGVEGISSRPKPWHRGSYCIDGQKAIEFVQAIGAAGTGYLRYGIFFAPHFVDLHAIFIPCMAGALTEKGLQRSEPPYRRARSSQGDPSQCRRRNPQHCHLRDLPNEGVEARECGLLA
jgi:hypothetical protein